MSKVQNDGAPAALLTVGASEKIVNDNDVDDEAFNKALLKDVEDLKCTLAPEPILSGDIDDRPSTIGSHGLPLSIHQGEEGDVGKYLFYCPSRAFGFPSHTSKFASSKHKRPETSKELGKELHLSPALSESTKSPPAAITPETLPVVDSKDGNYEAIDDISTPLEYDNNLSAWKLSEDSSWPHSSPQVFIPTIEYLQTPPHHRASYRRKQQEQLKSELGVKKCRLRQVASDIPAPEEEIKVEEEKEATEEVRIQEGQDTIISPPAVESRLEKVTASNCSINIPKWQRKPSFSHLNLPCYQRRPSGEAIDINYEYAFGVMYGRYTKELGQYARQESKKLQKEEKKSIKKISTDLRPHRGTVATKCMSFFSAIWRVTFARVGEDWVFLALLGISMAIVSFLMDYGIANCNRARIRMYKDLATHPALQYLSWIALPIFLILFSAGFVQILAPQAVGSGMPEIVVLLKGSGIPEMKTILRGVVLKEYLTFKTFLAKSIGLTATLGSGLPLGKEGPFVHIASIVATLLSRGVTTFKGIYENESRNSEMLAAACAVGVACSFAAPVGGVLFSIEVTSVYFAVRNYWRGFFAAVCGAMMFRLLAVWFNDEATLTPLFKTNFKVDVPFDPLELLVFTLLGAVCGFLGAFFVWVHRQYVTFMRKNKKMKLFLQKSVFLYPASLTLLVMTVQCPSVLGPLLASHITSHHQVLDLFSNITWTSDDLSVHEFEVVENWRNQWTGIFVNLIIYVVFTFCGSVVASTLPVPNGIFIPVFKIGAALGRFAGEAMATMFPNGLRYGGHQHIVIPGGYSIVGAAAMAGAVTHTISTSVIVFELTGQITHIIPVMIAVLIANGIAQLLQPSIYDSIIQIKKLPYLPDILTATSGAYNIYVENFMIRDVKYIWYGITYRELKNILTDHKKIRSLPLVDSHESMILLGSIERSELISLLEEHMGKDRRTNIISKWKVAAQKALEEEAEKKKKELQQQVKEEERRKRKKTAIATAMPSFGLAAMAAASGAVMAQTAMGLISPPDAKAAQDSSNTGKVSSANKETVALASGSSPLPSRPKSLPLPSGDKAPKDVLEKPDSESVAAVHEEPPAGPTETDALLDKSEKERRPSRFAVTKVETPAKNGSSVTLQIDPVEIPSVSETSVEESQASITAASPPPKGILKKTRSFVFSPMSSSPTASPQSTPYATVHASDSRLRQALENVLKKRAFNKSEECTNSLKVLSSPKPTKRTPTTLERLVEMTREQQRQWEEQEWNKTVEFSSCHIDPAPFQLVERTSLLKVHSLFSMLGLNHAYVTAIGRIIGVVALKELRAAVEMTNAGEMLKQKQGSDGGKEK